MKNSTQKCTDTMNRPATETEPGLVPITYNCGHTLELFYGGLGYALRDIEAAKTKPCLNCRNKAEVEAHKKK